MMQHFHMSYVFIPSLFISCIFSFLAFREEDCVYGTLSSSDTDLWWRHQTPMYVCVPYEKKRNRKERHWRTGRRKDGWKLRAQWGKDYLEVRICPPTWMLARLCHWPHRLWRSDSRHLTSSPPGVGGLSLHHFITPSQVPLYPPIT